MKDLIHKLEMDTLNPIIRKSKQKLNALFSEEFIEFGSSGKIYNKKDILESLPNEDENKILIQDFNVIVLSEYVALATYKAIINNITSLRSSVWKKNDFGWQMVFHQGTKFNNNA